MDEIKINKPISKKNIFAQHKKFFWMLVVVAIFYAVIYGTYSWKSWRGASEFSSDSYHVFFLQNGQVYFGHLMEKNAEEIVISEPYYLQPNDIETDNFNLIRVVDQLYGPENILVFTRNQIIFYQELRADSPVVESIGRQN